MSFDPETFIFNYTDFCALPSIRTTSNSRHFTVSLNYIFGYGVTHISIRMELLIENSIFEVFSVQIARNRFGADAQSPGTAPLTATVRSLVFLVLGVFEVLSFIHELRLSWPSTPTASTIACAEH